MPTPGLLRIKTVRGEAYEIGGRKLIPVVRVVSFGKARATIGTNWTGGWGTGFVWITPVAIVEMTPQGERTVAVADVTAKAVRGLLAGTLALAVFLAILRSLVRRRCRREAAG